MWLDNIHWKFSLFSVTYELALFNFFNINVDVFDLTIMFLNIQIGQLCKSLIPKFKVYFYEPLNTQGKLYNTEQIIINSYICLRVFFTYTYIKS